MAACAGALGVPRLYVGQTRIHQYRNSIKDKLIPPFRRPTVAKLTVSVMVLTSFSSALQLLKNGGRDEAMDEAKELIINSSPKHPEIEL